MINRYEKTANITTLDKVCTNKDEINTLLVDMESKYFLDILQNNIQEIFIIKVVSDHLDKAYPKKSWVIQIIQNTFKKWKHII